METIYKLIFSMIAIYLLVIFGKNLVESAKEPNWDGVALMGLCIFGLLGFIFWIIKIKNPQAQKK